jgi:hypothetical protein
MKTNQKNMADAIALIPISFQRIHTDFASGRRNIWVEDLGDEKALRGRLREVRTKLQFNFKGTTLKWGITCDTELQGAKKAISENKRRKLS